MNEIIENTVVEIDPETGLPITREGEATPAEAKVDYEVGSDGSAVFFVTEDATTSPNKAVV